MSAVAAKGRIRVQDVLQEKGGDKGKGKGGSKSLQQVPENVNMMDTLAGSSDVASAVRQALPDAAILRAQSILVQSDWDVPVCTHQTLSSRGGVAAVPREFVTDVLRRIGFTASPVAIVMSQEPDEIGLRGYPRQKVKCGLSVMGSDGTRTDVQVDRFLVQCGFGLWVSQKMRGPEVVLFSSMQGMICKLPERHGWPAGPRPASVVVAELSRLVPVDALSEFVSRDGPSVSFLVHVDFADTLLWQAGHIHQGKGSRDGFALA